MKEELFTKKTPAIVEAIAEAKKTGGVIYKDLESFDAWVKVPKAQPTTNGVAWI